MKFKEKPISKDNSRWRERAIKAMEKLPIDNPYESEEHKLALAYLEERDIEVKALRKNND